MQDVRRIGEPGPLPYWTLGVVTFALGSVRDVPSGSFLIRIGERSSGLVHYRSRLKLKVDGAREVEHRLEAVFEFSHAFWIPWQSLAKPAQLINQPPLPSAHVR